MHRVAAIFVLLSVGTCLAADEKQPPAVSFDYEAAYSHELKPHRRTIPCEGVHGGFNQLRVKLTVSPAGDVVDAKASGDGELRKYWPQLKDEVSRWKFRPFEKDGRAVTAEVEEYVDLVPPERLPTRHVAAPMVRSDSRVKITLQRTGCYGTCPAYTVSVSTGGIVFEGQAFVVATGKHTDTVDAIEVRKLANKFVAADFYSMDDNYTASVTDNPTFVLSISVDGRTKKVVDYVGAWEGMPAVVTELEEDVDELAGTQRWIKGNKGRIN